MDAKLQRLIAAQLSAMRRAFEIHADALSELARITGIEFTGSELPASPAEKPVEYRPDGFSVEVSEFGARRHKAVDEAVQKLRRRGDVMDAKTVPVWFVFGNWAEPELAAELYPDDFELRRIVQHAVNEVGGEWILFASYRRTPWFQPFRVEKDGPGYDVADRHSVVMLKKGWTPVEAMEHHAKRILEDGYFDPPAPSPIAPSPAPPPGKG